MLERVILLPYNGENHIIHVCANSDAKAVKQALKELCRREGKPTGSIKIDMNDIIIKIK